MSHNCVICNNWSFPVGRCIFGQQVPEDQRDPAVCDEFIPQSLAIQEMFESIRTYHECLQANTFGSYNQQDANNICLALHSEIDELLNSYDWKPWRPRGYAEIDRENMMVEIVDIMFFLGGFAEIFGITGRDLKRVFFHKLAENYNRIKEGYNEQHTSNAIDRSLVE